MKMDKWSTEEGYKSFNDTFYFLKGFSNNPFLSINNRHKKNHIKYVEVMYDNYLSLSKTLHKQKTKFIICFKTRKISKNINNKNIETYF